MGDTGSEAPYNTITLGEDDAAREMMIGSGWGPAADLANPSAGPDPATLNKTPFYMLCEGIARSVANVLTTKGQLLTYSTEQEALSVGATGYVLIADAGEDTGLRWGTVASASNVRLKKLLGERKVEMVIDPLLFRLYDITEVPTVVYAEGVNSACEHCGPAPRHWFLKPGQY